MMGWVQLLMANSRVNWGGGGQWLRRVKDKDSD